MSNFQLFRNSVRATPSSGGGTQSNELQAAIKSVTSSTDVKAVFLYDTKNTDSDGGAWRKKCKGLSWFDEGSSATRSARSEFPAMCLIVADGAAPDTVSLYDLDDPAAPLWLQFKRGTGSWSIGNMGLTDNSVSSLFALNGRLYVGQDSVSNLGVEEISFVDDYAYRYTASSTNGGYYRGNIAERQSGKGWPGSHSRGLLVNSVINDIAATVLEGAEIGALGLPIPTVCVSTANGNSIIHPNGDVYDLSDGASSRAYSGCRFRDNGDLFTWSSMNGSAQSWYRSKFYADTASGYWKYTTADDASRPHILADSTQVIEVGGDSVFTGGDSGLSIIKENLANPAEGSVAHITSTYNTGYMVGDIRGAWLANSSTDGAGATVHDRSVKGNDLTEQGTVNTGDVATDAELTYYTNFGSSNYLSRAYTSDLDFTNTMSVMFWVKDYGNSKDIYGIGTRSSTLSQSLYIDGGYDYRWTLSSNGATEQIFEFPEAEVLGEWTFVCFTMNAGAVRGYKNAQNVALNDGDGSTPATTFTGNIFSQATDTEGLEIGKGPIATTGSSGGKLSLFRISATAPTPETIKAIYEAEKVLFRSGAKCLLAANQVNDLAYDKTSGLLHVASESTASSKSFRGLEAVESLTSDGSLGLTAATEVDGITAAGGVLAAYDNAKVGVNLPSLDVRAELNEGEDKIPDDGKFHFSVSTPDATETVVGRIPVAENENVTVVAKAIGRKFNAPSSGDYYFGEIKQSFYRDAGSTIAARAEISKLENASLASANLDLDVNYASNTITLKVIGSGSSRMVWKASVEVQRISEKRYER